MSVTDIEKEVRVKKRRCRTIKTDGERCRKAAMIGLETCRTHGGAFPESQLKNRMAKLERSGLARMVTPIDADDWEANPLNSFEMEFRRTIANIRYFDEKLAALKEDDLTWGQTSEEKKDGIERDEVVSYTLTKYEARINLYYTLQMDQRKHLLQLQKTWIAAKLDVRHLEIQEQTVLLLDTAITSIVRGLGKDIADPDVRDIVRQSLIALPGVEQLTGALTIEG